MLNKIFPLLISILLISACKTNKQIEEIVPEGTVFLVRHADRDDGVDGLNKKGWDRANELAVMLEGANISAIYSSEYNRTQETAKPLCDVLGLDVIIYDARNIPLLVETIKKNHADKTVLVVGHSNTVPSTVNAFGIEPALKDLEHHQYSNLYLLNYGKKTEVKLLKFGEVSH